MDSATLIYDDLFVPAFCYGTIAFVAIRWESKFRDWWCYAIPALGIPGIVICAHFLAPTMSARPAFGLYAWGVAWLVFPCMLVNRGIIDFRQTFSLSNSRRKFWVLPLAFLPIGLIFWHLNKMFGLRDITLLTNAYLNATSHSFLAIHAIFIMPLLEESQRLVVSSGIERGNYKWRLIATSFVAFMIHSPELFVRMELSYVIYILVLNAIFLNLSLIGIIGFFLSVFIHSSINAAHVIGLLYAPAV